MLVLATRAFPRNSKFNFSAALGIISTRETPPPSRLPLALTNRQRGQSLASPIRECSALVSAQVRFVYIIRCLLVATVQLMYANLE